jgi:hypothetical protein
VSEPTEPLPTVVVRATLNADDLCAVLVEDALKSIVAAREAAEQKAVETRRKEKPLWLELAASFQKTWNSIYRAQLECAFAGFAAAFHGGPFRLVTIFDRILEDEDAKNHFNSYHSWCPFAWNLFNQRHDSETQWVRHLEDYWISPQLTVIGRAGDAVTNIGGFYWDSRDGCVDGAPGAPFSFKLPEEDYALCLAIYALRQEIRALDGQIRRLGDLEASVPKLMQRARVEITRAAIAASPEIQMTISDIKNLFTVDIE